MNRHTAEPEAWSCNVCLAQGRGAVERGAVRSNVRRFVHERFALWRCPRCRSIHAQDEVDLAHYYSGYPFHGGGKLGFLERVLYRNLSGRLHSAGLRREHTVLDYGCGNGMLVRYLQSAGYLGARGYDRYSPEFHTPALLDLRYDCVTSQDVLEHVAEPLELLRTFDRLTNPGGLIAVGTPNAAALDLQDSEGCIHGLHQPYHRHILSSAALRDAGQRLGWELVRFFPTEYVNTRVPFANVRFIVHLMQCGDNTLDAAFELDRVDARRVRNLKTLWYGLFGYFYADETGVTAIFRKPA